MKKLLAFIAALSIMLTSISIYTAAAEGEISEQKSEATPLQTAAPEPSPSETPEPEPRPTGESSGKYYIKDDDGDKLVRFTYTLKNGVATINGVNVYKDNTELVFPSEIDNNPVKRVENVSVYKNVTETSNGAAYGKQVETKIKSVTFGEGIESLYKVNFSNCENLESVYLADSIKTIDGGYFSFCPKLGKIHLPKNLKKGDYDFWGCESLESVTIPSGIEEIPEGCFRSCTRLKNVTFENGVKTIGEDAFSGCTSLGEIALPQSVTAISKGAFSGCTALKKISMSDNITYIGEHAFSHLGASKITLPQKLEEIDIRAFAEASLTELTIPASVRKIGKGAFASNAGLKKLTVSGSVKPDKQAFVSCYNLNDVTVKGEMSQELFTALSETPYGKKYLAESDEDFVIFDGNHLAKYNGTDKNPVIPEGVTELGFEAFQNAEIDTVTFPSTLSEIPEGCFKGADIKELTIPSTIKRVGKYAFYGCNKLEKLTIEDGVEVISEDAFMNCFALDPEKVSIGGKVRVSKNAFRQTALDEDFVQSGTQVGGHPWYRNDDDYGMMVPYIDGRRNALKPSEKFTDTAMSGQLALLQRMGIVSGYGDGTFRPEKDVTRGEAVKMMMLALGYSDGDMKEFAEDYKNGAVEETIRNSSDYNPDHWANVYLQRGVEYGIIHGFEDGTLRPDESVTLEQLLTMLVNITGYGGKAKQSGGYPYGYITQANEAGITNNLNTADYTKKATRAQTALCVYNALTAPYCEISEETRTWDGAISPEYHIWNGEGSRFRSLLTYNHKIYPVTAEVTGVSDDTLTVNITKAVNFGFSIIGENSAREARLNIENADNFKVGKVYKMFIRIDKIDEREYTLVAAEAAE